LITFFADRNLGRTFPDILRKAGISVEVHDDHFDPDTPDQVWLRAVGRRKWFALTHDSRIRYRPNERDAVLAARVGLFVLVGRAAHLDLAHNFVATAPVVYRFIQRHEPPFVAKVHRPGPSRSQQRRPGTVEMWLTEQQWLKRP
jgi:hypothetical protein